ncbi:MAG: M23 family peptidase, partial [Cyanobacteria bacterium]|nr:M23 family peptidase [Cyanobacteria bacterium bin.275]
MAIAIAVAAMVGRAMAQLQPPPVEPLPVEQSADQQALPPRAAPLRPDPAVLPNRPPTRFDASLDSLVRDGVVSPAERARIRSGSGMT